MTTETAQKRAIREIMISNKIILIDYEDFEKIKKFKWSVNKIGYVKRNVRGGENGEEYMHRFLLNVPKGMDTDHKSRNRLDNRKENLRLCSRSDNMGNTIKHKDSFSNFKGVTWDKRKQKWMAQIQRNGKHYFLGYFRDEKDAAARYNKKSRMLFGEFSYV